jgi:hypothetical protein
MSELLTAEGYAQTKQKLADLQRRLAEIEKRTDLDADHLAGVLRSYKMMMREYLKDIKLYEARLGKHTSAPSPLPSVPCYGVLRMLHHSRQRLTAAARSV